MPNLEYGVAITEELCSEIERHLIKENREEDLLFALWAPSRGAIRLTALIHTPIFPSEGDRQQHGNVSFNPQYFERICSIAVNQKCGIAFLHSHPGPGWQGMSDDDIKAEEKMAGTVAALTDLPLLGMTVGSDGTWSARMWEFIQGKQYSLKWCGAVRKFGKRLWVYFADSIIPKPRFSELFKRTVTVWGKDNHDNLARLRIGIVGLGSVGSVVAESLARMGIERFSLIDFDEVQPHNLDRLLGATKNDIGELKISVGERQIRNSSTATRTDIITVPYSVAEEKGYQAALDCDVLFSCVDRPRPRSILNHFAFSHLIPVIDGGIEVRFKEGQFSGVDWQVQTVGPGRSCLRCIGAFDSGDVETEKAGKLDDPTYLKGLPADHRFKRNENVFPFSSNLGSLEVLQFIALDTGISGIEDFGIQRYRYHPGILELLERYPCLPNCDTAKLVAQGDKMFQLCGRDLGAEAARERQKRSKL